MVSVLGVRVLVPLGGLLAVAVVGQALFWAILAITLLLAASWFFLDKGDRSRIQGLVVIMGSLALVLGIRRLVQA